MRSCPLGLIQRLLAVLLLLAPVSPLRAQPAPVCADPGASLLWRVEGPALTKQGTTLHLFGSIHVGKAEFYPLHPRIEQVFRDADRLVFEVDPESAADPQAAMRVQLRGLLPAGQTLPDTISPAAWGNLQQILAQLDIPEQGFLYLKPWLVTMMLANVQAKALGYEARYGLESYFFQQKPAGTQILELESLEQQVDILDGLDPELLLNYSLSEFDASAEDMERLVYAWQCADRDTLNEVLFEGLEAVEAGAGQPEIDMLHTALFTERNLHMADGIEAFIREGGGNWFVVVGTAHLLGEGSVVDLLRQRGYHVEAVRLD